MVDVGSVRYEVELDDSKVAQQAEKTEKTITSKLGGAAKKVGAASAAAVGLTVGAITAAGNAVLKSADEVSKAGDEIDKMSQKIGISTDAFQEWSYVFERSGADISGLQVGMKTLAGVIVDAGNGSEGAAKKLEAVGISLDEIVGLSQEDQLGLVISRLQEMEAGAERSAAASDLLGRSATDMAAVLNMTAEDTQALIDEAHDYGMVMSEDAVAASAAYQDSLTKLHGTMGGIKNQIVANFLPGLTMVVDGLSEVANGSKALDEAVDDGITLVLSSLTDSLPQMIERGVDIILAIVDGITNNLPAIMDAGFTIIGKLVEALIELAPKLLEAAVKILVTLGSYLIEHAPDLLAYVGQLFAKVIEAITSIDWAQTGTDIINGIKRGIENAAHLLKEAAKNALSGAVDSVKGFLGISSPSKLFRDEVGEMIPAGVAEGIDDGQSYISDSMDRMIRSFTADVNYNVPQISDYAADLGAAVTASSSTEITVPLIVDGREMARATAWYTNEQLAWEAR